MASKSRSSISWNSGSPKPRLSSEISFVSVHQAREHRSIGGIRHRSYSLTDRDMGVDHAVARTLHPPGESLHSYSNSMDTSLSVSLSRTKTTTLFMAMAFS